MTTPINNQCKKGIILAGGRGTRLHPLTKILNKQLLPIYDKPMIYYPLSILMLMGIREIMIIVNPEDVEKYDALLGDGSHLGIHITYKIQLAPNGLPEAFTLGKEFIGNNPVTMILGDNILYGSGLIKYITGACLPNHSGASIFTFPVSDPERFGVVHYDKESNVVKLEEKPQDSPSNWAMCGLYHFDPDVVEYAAKLKPSARGELEMVDLLNMYHSEGRLNSFKMGRGYAWLDTGTVSAMIEASKYIEILEKRQMIKVACIEEIALRKEYISVENFEEIAKTMSGGNYGAYLATVLKEYKQNT